VNRCRYAALAAWLAVGTAPGAAQQADWRTWSSKVGAPGEEGRFARLLDNKVVIETRGGTPRTLTKASLSVEDQDYLAGLASISTADWLLADWSGMSAAARVRHQAIRISRSESRLTAQGTWYQAVPRERALKMSATSGGKKADAPSDCRVVRESYEVSVNGDSVTLKGLRAKCLLGPPEMTKACPATTFNGKFEKPGILTGTWADTNGETGRFWWARDDALYKPAGSNIEAGASIHLAPLDGTPCSYSAYVPTSYDPARATPVLINDSPGGNAPPLSTDAADAVNWIMVGLAGVRDGISERVDAESTAATLFDLARRFKLDRKRVYFSGMANGGRRAANRGIFFEDYCAGLICIASGFSFTKQGAYDCPPLAEPTVFIIGEKDLFSGSEVIHRVFPEEKSKGRMTRLIKHPGADGLAPPELNAEAIRWLDGLKSSRKAAAVKPATESATKDKTKNPSLPGPKK